MCHIHRDGPFLVTLNIKLCSFLVGYTIRTKELQSNLKWQSYYILGSNADIFLKRLLYVNYEVKQVNICTGINENLNFQHGKKEIQL